MARHLERFKLFLLLEWVSYISLFVKQLKIWREIFVFRKYDNSRCV